MESITYEKLLKRDGKVITHVVGNSMRPLLYDRESIVVVEDAEREVGEYLDAVAEEPGEFGNARGVQIGGARRGERKQHQDQQDGKQEGTDF